MDTDKISVEATGYNSPMRRLQLPEEIKSRHGARRREDPDGQRKAEEAICHAVSKHGNIVPGSVMVHGREIRLMLIDTSEDAWQETFRFIKQRIANP